MLNNQLAVILTKAGWHSHRKTIPNVTTIPPCYPKKVLAFLSEYGQLKLHGDPIYSGRGRVTFLSIITKEYCLAEYQSIYETPKFKLLNPIDISEEEDTVYYFSTLVGTPLYPIASQVISNQADSPILMDKWNNFYIISQLGDLCWLARDAMECFEKMLFGTDHPPTLVLNEDKLVWQPPVGQILFYSPPINPQLTENPWP
jgi:SUKH-3 immunity protein